MIGVDRALTLFDVIAGLILLVSVLVGFARGALREVITVIALAVAIVAAVLALRLTGPLARAAIHPAWAGTVAALAVVFLAIYILLRVFGAALIRSVHNTSGLGGVDRAIGGGFGLVRGLIALGLLVLVFNVVTPPGTGADLDHQGRALSAGVRLRQRAAVLDPARHGPGPAARAGDRKRGEGRRRRPAVKSAIKLR